MWQQPLAACLWLPSHKTAPQTAGKQRQHLGHSPGMTGIPEVIWQISGASPTRTALKSDSEDSHTYLLGRPG